MQNLKSKIKMEMRKVIFNPKQLTLVLIFLLGPSMLVGGVAELSKEFEKTLTLASSDGIELKNTLGDVHINTVEGNQFSITAEIKVEAKDAAVAQKLLDRLNIEYKQSGSKHIFKADHGGEVKSMNYSKGQKKIVYKDGFKANVKKYSVEITMSMPRNNSLAVQQSFNDLYLGDMDAPVELELKHANFKIGKLNSAPNLNFKFSNGEVASLTNGKLNAEYTNMSLRDEGKLELNSKFSNISIDHAKQLSGNNAYDNLDIDELGDLLSVAKFSNFEIETLSGGIEADLEYGGIEVKRLKSTFTGVDFKGKFADIELKLDHGTSFNFNITHKHSGIDLPSGLTKHKEGPPGGTQVIEGGNGGNMIQTNTKYGSVEIKLEPN